ncbi:hypothetical protein Hanom_Chr06g00536651 [Helianthus anomalus]
MASYLYKGLEVQLLGSRTLILKPHISQQCPKGWLSLIIITVVIWTWH